MKRFCLLLIIAFILLVVPFSVAASGQEELIDTSSVSDALPSDVRNALKELGISAEDLSSVSEASFSSLLGYTGKILAQESKALAPSVSVLLAVMVIYSLFRGFFDSVATSELEPVISVVAALCISAVILIPVSGVISLAGSMVKTASDFMLAFAPVMAAVLITDGQTATGSGYASLMIMCAQGVAQFFSKFITPVLSAFLSLSVASSVVPDINITSVVAFFSKTIKWLVSFVFTLFTGFLTLKTVYTSSVDNLSTRAVRYTMSSFVPVVGGALSEAYRTVHAGVKLLKSGVGIFVIIAVFIMFAPILAKLIVWLLSVNLCKTFSQVSSLGAPYSILSCVSTVLSLMLSVILCIVALFVITTALIITIGGGA